MGAGKVDSSNNCTKIYFIPGKIDRSGKKVDKYVTLGVPRCPDTGQSELLGKLLAGVLG